jgi:hypothetical protein
MLRRITTILIAPVLALGIANAVVLIQGRATGEAGPGTVGPAWQRWRGLPTDVRAAHVRRFQDIVQRPDATGIWQSARRFARLPSAHQQALRTLQRLLTESLEHESPARRRDLLRSPPRAQAFFAYQALSAEDPERVIELAKCLRSTPSGG